MCSHTHTRIFSSATPTTLSPLSRQAADDWVAKTVAREVTRRKESFWQKALIYCQILAGEISKAEFGLTLLQETETVNPTFLALAEGC